MIKIPTVLTEQTDAGCIALALQDAAHKSEADGHLYTAKHQHQLAAGAWAFASHEAGAAAHAAHAQRLADMIEAAAAEEHSRQQEG